MALLMRLYGTVIDRSDGHQWVEDGCSKYEKVLVVSCMGKNQDFFIP